MTERDPLATQETLISPEIEKRHLWVSVIGVPGSRKTTLARLVGGRLGFSVVEEMDVTALPIFRDYNSNPQEYSLPFQLLVWDESLRQFSGGPKTSGIREIRMKSPVISEPFIRQHCDIYARARMESQPKNLERYQSYVEGTLQGKILPNPDFIFYAYVDFKYMLEGIKKRATQNPESRESERENSDAYWLRLWELTEDWIRRNPLNLRMIKVNMQLFDRRLFRNDDKCDEALVIAFMNWMSYETINPKTGELRGGLDFQVPEIISNHRPQVHSIR